VNHVWLDILSLVADNGLTVITTNDQKQSMAGLCGVIGESQHIESIAADLEWTGEETTTCFEADKVSIAGSFTEETAAEQPVTVGADSLLWVWGTAFGFEQDGEYRPRNPTSESTVTYCANLYEKHGTAFVSGLNGDFVGVLYDRQAETVSIFTDRLALRDAYFVQPTEETFVFSTSIQSLPRHPQVTPAFDRKYISEYFSCHFRTFGEKTPLKKTYLLHPGTITTVDPLSLEQDTQQYWTPNYRPGDRPFSYFLEEFASRFSAAVTERLHADKQYGLLLSGGIDSRLVLSAVPPKIRENLTAYHCAGWMNREARTAERVAQKAGVDFEWLQRDSGYHQRALSRNPQLSNFVGTFEQAHLEGFMDEIRGEVDEVMTASFADSNFKGYSFPRYSFEAGPLGTIELPMYESMNSIEDYIDFWITDPPAYLGSVPDARAVMRSEIRPTQSGIDHHGITYGSPEELFTCGMLTPRTNGSVLFLLQSLRHHLPAWSPYVDNRLVDLYLSMPKKYFVRRNVILRSIEQLDPDLADIRYVDTGLPPRYPLAAHLIGDHCRRFVDKYLPVNDPPAPHLSHGPWPDISTMIREQSFLKDALKENERLIRQLEFLDWEGVWECYEEHIAGEHNHDELYGLVTLLEMPVTERIVNESE